MSQEPLTEPPTPPPRGRYWNNIIIVLFVLSATAVLWQPSSLNHPRKSIPLEALGIVADDVKDSPYQRRLRDSLTDGNLMYLSDHYQRTPFQFQGSHTDGLLLVPTLDRIMVGEGVQRLPSVASWTDYATLNVHIDHNETFIAIPLSVPACSIIRHRKSSVKGQFTRGSEVTFWARVTHEGYLDTNAFVPVGDEVLITVCPDVRRRRTASVPLLSNISFKATYPQDIECSAQNIASVRGALGMPRLGMHVVLFSRSKERLLKKSEYIQKIISNAKGFPFHVDLYLHVNTGFDPGMDDGVALLRSDSLFTIEEMWFEQNITTGAQNVVLPQEEKDDVSPPPDLLPPPAGPPPTPLDIDAVVPRGSLLLSPEYLAQFVLRQVAGVTSARPSPKLRIFVVSHPVRESGGFFPFKARQQIQHQFFLYDLVLFSEDDMDVKPINLEYYCKFKNAARDQGHYLAFFRVEYGRKRPKNPSGKILSDVLRAQKISRHSPPIRFGATVFAQVEIQVYHAFWLADRRDLAAMIADSRFMIKDFTVRALLLEEASCLHGPMMLTRVYNSSKIFPIDTSTRLVHPMCEVHHMSNAYAERGLAFFHDAGRVEFRNDKR